MALKLRRAEERFIPQSTRAASFKRLLGGLVTVTGLHDRPRHDENAGKRAQWQRKEEPLEAAIAFALRELAVQNCEPRPKS